MKQNKTNIHKWLGGSGYKSPWLSYPTLFIVAAALALFYLVFGIYTNTPDTYSYMRAGELLFNGELHITRPPVYPFILHTIGLIFGNQLQQGIVISLQCLVFFISIVYFRKLIFSVTDSLKATFWATALYAIYPGFGAYYLYLLTESFATSFVIFFLWSLCSSLPKQPGIKQALWSGFWLMTLIYLRPVMICLIPVYIIFWAWIALKWKRSSLACVSSAICVLLICVSSLLMYKHQIKVKYDINSISAVSSANNFCLLRELDIIGPEDTENPLFKEHLARVKGTRPYSSDLHFDWDEIHYIGDTLKVSVQDIDKAVNHASSGNYIIYLRSAKRHTERAARHKLLPFINAFPFYYIEEFSPFTLSCYFLFMIVAFILLVWKCRSILPWTLFLTSAAISGAALIGAMDEFTRLLSPAMPSAWLLCVFLFLPAFRAWRTKLN